MLKLTPILNQNRLRPIGPKNVSSGRSADSQYESGQTLISERKVSLKLHFIMCQYSLASEIICTIARCWSRAAYRDKSC